MDTTYNEPSTLTSQRDSAIRVIKFMLFAASIVPSIVGGSLAFYYGFFTWGHFLLVALALFIGQAGGDYLYYHFTHRHSDPRDSHTKIFAGWRPFFTELLPEKNGTLIAGFVCLLVDLAIGVYFYNQLGYEVLILAALGGLVAIFFTPLMLMGFKEAVVFVTFGPLCLLGMYFVLTGDISYIPVVASLPFGFLVTVVAYLKGAKFDVKVIEGKEIVVKLNRQLITILTILAYLSLVINIAVGILPLWTLVALIASLPLSISVIQVIRKDASNIEDYLWAVVRSIFALSVAGVLTSMALIYQAL